MIRIRFGFEYQQYENETKRTTGPVAVGLAGKSLVGPCKKVLLYPRPAPLRLLSEP